MKIYILLIISHIIGDVLLQRNIILNKVFKGKELWNLKRQNVWYLVFHVILYTIPIGIALIYLKVFAVYKVLVVLISHFIIDYFKCYIIVYEYMTLRFFIVNLIDQLIHIGILFIIVNM